MTRLKLHQAGTGSLIDYKGLNMMVLKEPQILRGRIQLMNTQTGPPLTIRAIVSWEPDGAFQLPQNGPMWMQVETGRAGMTPGPLFLKCMQRDGLTIPQVTFSIGDQRAHIGVVPRAEILQWDKICISSPVAVV